MITSLCWVNKGTVQPNSERILEYNSQDELDDIDGDEDDISDSKMVTGNDTENDDILHMDQYDQEEDDQQALLGRILGSLARQSQSIDQDDSPTQPSKREQLERVTKGKGQKSKSKEKQKKEKQNDPSSSNGSGPLGEGIEKKKKATVKDGGVHKTKKQVKPSNKKTKVVDTNDMDQSISQKDSKKNKAKAKEGKGGSKRSESKVDDSVLARASLAALSALPDKKQKTKISAKRNKNTQQDIDEEENSDSGVQYAGDDYPSYVDWDQFDTESDGDDNEGLSGTENIILATNTENDAHTLQVWVYEGAQEKQEAQLWVDNEGLLGGFPLCMSISYDGVVGKEEGSWAAVGCKDAGVEIFDCSYLDDPVIEPVVVLVCPSGGQSSKAAGAGGKKQKRGWDKSASVLCCEWNAEYRNVLTGGLSDGRVCMWDCASGKVSGSFAQHSKAVQSVAWHREEANLLLSGGFDSEVHVVDVRSKKGGKGESVVWRVGGEVEMVTWLHSTCGGGNMFVVGTDKGGMEWYDVRKGGGSACVAYVDAHKKALTCLDINSEAPNLLCSGGIDKCIKVWDVGGSGGGFECVYNTKIGGAGALFTLGWCSDDAYLIAVGGDEGSVLVVDVLADSAFKQKYGDVLEGGGGSV